jgi:hypothetical protein
MSVERLVLAMPTGQDQERSFRDGIYASRELMFF